METGTGKTYVYTHAIFELHQRYGFNKFIVLVPNLAIKAGARQFLTADYAKRHFRDDWGYQTEMDVHILEAQKGKRYFPSAVRNFVEGSNFIRDRIQVLVVNMSLFQESKNGMLTRDDYDSAVENFYTPADAIAGTRPILLIDEPHRFKEGKKTFDFVKNRIRPQAILRFGATFPEAPRGKMKSEETKTDYKNLIYLLSAFDSFNLNLVKGVAKEHLESPSGKEAKVKLVSMKKGESATFHHIRADHPLRTCSLQAGDSLAQISSVFEGLVITGIEASKVLLSDGRELERTAEFEEEVFSGLYQEKMIELALKRHFETERENFKRQNKIKTLALFFIDDPNSYRDEEGYLKEAFNRILKAELKDAIRDTKQRLSQYPMLEDYKAYLEASLADLGATQAGYFSRDNQSSDKEIEKEIEEILVDKEKLLRIYLPNGEFNTRRFIFSKWTLREGWDNPNVFTIAKLRSSGSKESKLQEVGRGLRLPVDEYGTRLSDERFMLNYIVDFTEKKFAQELVAEIQGGSTEAAYIREDKLRKLAEQKGLSFEKLKALLILSDYIHDDLAIIWENREELSLEYPELMVQGLDENSVRDRNLAIEKPPAGIRADKYQELKKLWEALNQKFFVYYEKIDDDEIVEALAEHLHKGVLETKQSLKSSREIVEARGILELRESNSLYLSYQRSMRYSDFLGRLRDLTDIPLKLIHQALVKFSKKNQLPQNAFNERSLGKWSQEIQSWRSRILLQRIQYKPADGASIHPTKLTNEMGEPLAQIEAVGSLGKSFSIGDTPENYLYDIAYYDSPLEKANINTQMIDSVQIFAKIPQRSIRIPVIGGHTYSPDFMYVVKKDDGSITLNLVVETKDVRSDDDLRKNEHMKIECAKKFFAELSKQSGIVVKYHKQLAGERMTEIVRKLLAK